MAPKLSDEEAVLACLQPEWQRIGTIALTLEMLMRTKDTDEAGSIVAVHLAFMRARNLVEANIVEKPQPSAHFKLSPKGSEKQAELMARMPNLKGLLELAHIDAESAILNSAPI